MSTSQSEYTRQLNWRLKQIEIGKATTAYTSYIRDVPKFKRRRDHPSTPDPYDARMSKRQYEGRVKAWKRTLHELYPDELKKTGSHSGQRKQLRMNLFVRDRHEYALYEGIAEHPNVNIVLSETTDNDSWLGC